MSDDELDPSNDPSTDPAQERVRRLLAEARHDAPMPDDVAARMDATLAGLQAERRRESVGSHSVGSQPVGSQTVVSLDVARRRRRRWATGLVAAAAAVVLGVSLPNLTGGVSMSGGDSEAGGAADAPTSQDESLSRELAEEPGADSEGCRSAGEAAPSDSAAPFSAPAELDPGRFKQDAVAARDAVVDDQAELEARPVVCGDVPADAEQVVVVRYDDQDGYLVFEPDGGSDGRQRVTLYLCPGGVPARQALVAGP